MSVQFFSTPFAETTGNLSLEVHSEIRDVATSYGTMVVEIKHLTRLLYSMETGLRKNAESMEIIFRNNEVQISGFIHLNIANLPEYKVAGYFLKTIRAPKLVDNQTYVIYPDEIEPVINGILSFYFAEEMRGEVNAKRYQQISARLEKLNRETEALQALQEAVLFSLSRSG